MLLFQLGFERSKMSVTLRSRRANTSLVGKFGDLCRPLVAQHCFGVVFPRLCLQTVCSLAHRCRQEEGGAEQVWAQKPIVLC